MKEYVEKMYMCPNCFELFTKEEAEKMNNIHVHEDSDSCSEVDDYLIPIDKPIAESIAKMNKKGWKTLFSCSGHYYGTHTFSEFYVTFEIDDFSFHMLPKLMMLEPVGMEYEIERNSTLDISGLTCYRCRISPRNKDYTFMELFTSNYNIEVDDKPLFEEKDYEKYMGWKDRVYHKSFQEWVDRIPCLNDSIDVDTTKSDIYKELDDIINKLNEYLSDKIDKEYSKQGFIDICRVCRSKFIDALKIVSDTSKTKMSKSLHNSLAENSPISIKVFNDIMNELNINYFVESFKNSNNKNVFCIRYKRD